MERQTKHRILGVLVLVGLVVLALPFFQTSNELPSESALVKTPPFPDQAIQNNNTNTAQNQEIAAEPLPLAVTTAPLITPIQDEPAKTEASVAQAQPVEAPEQSVAQPLAQPVQPMPNVAPMVKNDLPPGSVRDTAEGLKPVKQKAKTVKVAQKPRKHMIGEYQVLDPADLAGVKSKAWAVQIGSFKNKTNATRLVNALRSRGYRSFIDQASNKKGLTKVMVGPERQKDAAHHLAAKLEKETNIRGVVVTYKPLAL